MENHYLKKAEQILKDLEGREGPSTIEFKDYTFRVDPGVFPSHQFRTTLLLMGEIAKRCKDMRVCDMGCAYGLMGLHALRHAAKTCVFVDINPVAIANTRANIRLQTQSVMDNTPLGRECYQSDCFDDVPPQVFDLIVFNPPFHSEDKEVEHGIERALFDPGFESMRKFLSSVRDYCHKNTQILIAFSNKGDTKSLERLFSEYDFEYRLCVHENTHAEYDNRVYELFMNRINEI